MDLHNNLSVCFFASSFSVLVSNSEYYIYILSVVMPVKHLVTMITCMINVRLLMSPILAVLRFV